jgi:hypothetical protein
LTLMRSNSGESYFMTGHYAEAQGRCARLDSLI